MPIFMDEKLDRKELLIQSIHEREKANLGDLTATVPVHLRILEFPASLRTDETLLQGARETVKAWYDEDMAYHLDALNAHGDDPSLVRGFERFDDGWILSGSPDEKGFLALSWRNNGRIDTIKFCKVPVHLYNQWERKGKFYTPETGSRNKWIESFGRNLCDSEVIFMDPEKMRKYGIECELARISLETGRAEVLGHAFCSEYQPNMGKALLLRDFAVFYLNKLLEKANGSS